MSEPKIWLKILSFKAQKTLVSLLTHVTDGPGDAELCALGFPVGFSGEGHLIEPTSFTLRWCDVVVVVSLWIKLSSVLFGLSKTIYRSPLQFHKN